MTKYEELRNRLTVAMVQCHEAKLGEAHDTDFYVVTILSVIDKYEKERQMKDSTGSELLEEAQRILEERATKYNSSKVSRDDYWIYGASSIITELYRKVLTLVSLDTSGQLTHERAANELPDIINYSRFLWEYTKKHNNYGFAPRENFGAGEIIGVIKGRTKETE